jgi:hypothetical protein
MSEEHPMQSQIYMYMDICPDSVICHFVITSEMAVEMIIVLRKGYKLETGLFPKS